MDVGLRIVALLLALACFVSFLWALRSLFLVPGGKFPGRMRLLSACGTVFFVIHLIFLVQSSINPVWWVLGISLYLASFALFWWTVPHARTARLRVVFSAGETRRLYVRGPYRYIRHPFYSSYLAFWLAGVMVTAKPALGITLLIMGWFYFQAMREEEYIFSIRPLG